MIAAIRGPYSTRASTRPGPRRGSAPRTVIRARWCSVAVTVTGGMSNCWRDSTRLTGRPAKPRPQPRQACGSRTTTWSGAGDLAQRRPGMTGLPTRLTSALAAQRLRRRLGERRIGRGRLSRILAIRSQLPAQLVHLGPQRVHHRAQRRVLRHKIGVGRFWTVRHRTTIGAPSRDQHATPYSTADITSHIIHISHITDAHGPDQLQQDYLRFTTNPQVSFDKNAAEKSG